MAHVDIDPRGDLLLICGLGDDQRRLLVSSAVIREASPVFDAFILRKVEQHSLAPNATISIAPPVPENGSQAMGLLCNILHNRNNLVPQRIDLQVLKSVLALIDKYKFSHPSLRICMPLWLRNCMDMLDCVFNETEVLVTLLYGALKYVLKDYATRVGLLLVKTTTGSLTECQYHTCKAMNTYLSQLESIRETFKRDLLKAAENQVRGQGEPDPRNLVSCHGNCKHAKKNVEDYIDHLEDWGLWPPESVTIRSLANTYLMCTHTEYDDHELEKEKKECSLYCTMAMVDSFTNSCADLQRKSKENEKILDRWLHFDSTLENGVMKGFQPLPPPPLWRQKRKLAGELEGAIKKMEIKKKQRQQGQQMQQEKLRQERLQRQMQSTPKLHILSPATREREMTS